MNKERAASYLGAGMPPGQVANIMGCTPAYISQLLKEESFVELVEKHRAAVDGSEAAEEVSIQKKYLGMEHTLLKAMAEALPNAELPAITRALEVVANRQEKAAVRKMPQQIGGGNGGQNVAVHVSLTLPTHAIESRPVIELNAKSEVVSIDSKPMAPMSSVGVEKLFREKKAEREAAPAILKEL